jgi:hypothetical protein
MEGKLACNNNQNVSEKQESTVKRRKSDLGSYALSIFTTLWNRLIRGQAVFSVHYCTCRLYIDIN